MAASAVSAGWGRAVGDSPAAAALRSVQRERGACSGAPRLLRASALFLRWRNRAAADRPDCSGSRGCASRLRRSTGPAARLLRCIRRGIRRGWRHGTSSAAARCGMPPIPFLTRPRPCDQLQHSGTLRGADVITDHGAEHVAIVQRIPASIILQLVVSIFLPFTLFFVFSGVLRPLRKKKEKKHLSEFEEHFKTVILSLVI